MRKTVVVHLTKSMTNRAALCNGETFNMPGGKNVKYKFCPECWGDTMKKGKG